MTAGAFTQLCFTLAAPYGSWGTSSRSSATTARKATDLDPPKSALVGLLGAALGLPRDRLGDLSTAIRVAVRTGVRPRHDLRPDFHTITSASRPEGRERWSRFDELRQTLNGKEQSGALLSRREYWSCGLWTVAVVSDDPAFPLDGLADALRRPHWPLYAGRKACALGLPPDPDLLTASGPIAALNAYGWPWTRLKSLSDSDREKTEDETLSSKALEIFGPLRRHVEAGEQAEDGDDTVCELACDPDYPGAAAEMAGAIKRIVRRHDHPIPLPLSGGRIYQRFEDRDEVRMAWPKASGSTAG